MYVVDGPVENDGPGVVLLYAGYGGGEGAMGFFVGVMPPGTDCMRLKARSVRSARGLTLTNDSPAGGANGAGVLLFCESGGSAGASSVEPWAVGAIGSLSILSVENRELLLKSK